MREREIQRDVSGFLFCWAHLQQCISEKRLMRLSLRLHGWRRHHKDCNKRPEWKRGDGVKNGGNKQDCTWGSDSGDHRSDSSVTVREKQSKQNILTQMLLWKTGALGVLS